METFIQVEESYRIEGISGHSATGETPSIPGQAVL